MAELANPVTMVEDDIQTQQSGRLLPHSPTPLHFTACHDTHDESWLVPCGLFNLVAMPSREFGSALQVMPFLVCLI